MARKETKSVHLTARISASLDGRINRLSDTFSNNRSRVIQGALVMGVRELERTLDLVSQTPEDIQEEFAELLALDDVDAAVRLWNKREAQRISA